ncbi:MAG: L,D-transpeptidase [Verrucomicrobiota bacterium]|nr:L,D-transpeptidase [Verrucomicrobiota bacterium]
MRLLLLSLVAFCVCLTSASAQLFAPDVVISVRDQRLMLMSGGRKIATYPVSTSKFGLGDRWGSMATPLGFLQVVTKIGGNAPTGAVFHNRRFTGEVLRPNAPGRDPITTRILWLRGLESTNAHAYQRCIYIHGTNEERFIGRPASYGCIRMRGRDVADLYQRLPLGAVVQITESHMPRPFEIARTTVPLNQPMPATTAHVAEQTTRVTDVPAVAAKIAPKTPAAPQKPAKKSNATAMWARNARA